MKILAGIILIIVIVMAVVFTVKDSNRIKSLHESHSGLTTKDYFKGKVDSLTIIKGATFLTVENKKYFIHTASNYEYSQIHLSKILTLGDSIVKQFGSDTIFIYKKEKIYMFINNKRINR